MVQLTAFYATGVTGYAAVGAITRILLAAGFAYDVAHFLATLTAAGNAVDDLPVLPDGPAQAFERQMAPAWLGLFTLAAAERMAELDTERQFATIAARETQYFDRHRDAEERRQRAAALQDVAAMLNSDRSDANEHLLGWRAVLDERTTPECRWAHGRNFDATKMPSIGFPGAVHMRCRCSAGPAVPGAPVIPAV